MALSTDRLDIRLSAEDKEYIRQAAEALGSPVASFVREAAVSYAEEVLGSAKGKKKPERRAAKKLTWAQRMRGTAPPGLSTDEIMKLTRDTGR